MTPSVLEGVREGRTRRPDGRVVAWCEWGPVDGVPLLRVPGTPGSRHSMRADRTPWAERGLRVVTTERPGFGASTRLPGRGFAEPADDLAAVLDALEIERAHVIGGSGSAPHQLCLAARHPERVVAMSIVVGGAPPTPEEVAREVGINRLAYELITSGDLDGLRALLAENAAALTADPLAAFGAIMAEAPAADRSVMAEPAWQEAFAVGVQEALRQGADGWADESIALLTRWDDVDLAAVRTSLTWWHGAADANAPLSAAERLLAQIPHAELRLFEPHEGHMAGYHREGEILDELLARG
jgi:pimeloyl-ACP methyl ester carboxylesterase